MFLNIYHTFAFVSLLAKRLITGVSKIQKPLKYDINFDQYQIHKMSIFRLVKGIENSSILKKII